MSEPYINAEEINDRAKLLMHRLIARQLANDSSLIERARQCLDFLRYRGRQNTYDLMVRVQITRG